MAGGDHDDGDELPSVDHLTTALLSSGHGMGKRLDVRCWQHVTDVA